jgi:UrcA family protein
MNGRNLAYGAAAALVSSLLLLATSADAQPGQSAVVIQKHITPTIRYVAFADLPLATKSGQRVLYQRVSDAIGQVCMEVEKDGFEHEWPGCRDLASRDARPQIDQAIALAQSRLANSAATMPITIAVSAAEK